MKIDQDSKVPKIQYSSAGVTSVECGRIRCILNTQYTILYSQYTKHYTLYTIHYTLYTIHYALLLAIYSQDENGRLAICN